ncbi:MAG TPA: type II toxin-antitoxin system VapC family toxin [Candidatus Saccharimonadales bacterium]|jgi:predicted nucleic acid-binding protein
MTYILDTTAYSEFYRGNNKLKKWFKLDNLIIMPMIVIGELRAGFRAGNKLEENEKLLQRFLESPNVSPVSISDKTTRHYGEIFVQLKKDSKPIGSNDMWIAALALEFDKPVLTMDKDFQYVKSIETIEI